MQYSAYIDRKDMYFNHIKSVMNEWRRNSQYTCDVNSTAI